MSPSARCIAECKRRGWIAQNVEQTIPRTFIKRDLFGVIDIVAATPTGILGIQATSGDHSANRRTKILAEPRMKLWLAAGARLAVWSWSKRGARGERKLWTLREVEITAADFQQEAA